MAPLRDIFLSYEHTDHSKAKKLAESLEHEGWTVWWDPRIPPGQTWATVIESCLKSSRCVVVLWSETSIKSKWVNKEARFADKFDLLVPALIHDVKPPFEFEHIQAANLIDWDGTGTEGFSHLTAELRSRLQSPDGQTAPAIENAQPQPKPATRPPNPRIASADRPEPPTPLPQASSTVAPVPAQPSLPVAASMVERITRAQVLGYAALVVGFGATVLFVGWWLYHVSSNIRFLTFFQAIISANTRSLPVTGGMFVLGIIVRLSWYFADREYPTDIAEYTKVFIQSSAMAVIFFLLYIWLVWDPAKPPPVAVLFSFAIAASWLTIILYAIKGSNLDNFVQNCFAINVVGALVAIVSNFVTQFVPELQIAPIVAAMGALDDSWEGTSVVVAIVCAGAIVGLSWHFAAEEHPYDSLEYAAVALKSTISAVVLCFSYLWLFSGNFDVYWLDAVPGSAVAAASLTVLLYAIKKM